MFTGLAPPPAHQTLIMHSSQRSEFCAQLPDAVALPHAHLPQRTGQARDAIADSRKLRRRPRNTVATRSGDCCSERCRP